MPWICDYIHIIELEVTSDKKIKEASIKMVQTIINVITYFTDNNDFIEKIMAEKIISKLVNMVSLFEYGFND